jgi:hypothetical protein
MSNSNLLFNGNDLQDRLRQGQEGARQAVEDIPRDQFLISSDRDITQNVAANWRLEPLVLHWDQREMEDKEINLLVRDYGREVYVPGTQITVTVPFTGTGWLWTCRTNPSDTMPPVGSIHSHTNVSGVLSIETALPHNASPERFKQWYENASRTLARWVNWSSAQVDAYNASIEDYIATAVAIRRGRLKAHSNLSQILDIPLKSRPGAPSIVPILLERRSPPRLPLKVGSQPEPGISDASYEHILSVIRHEGRSFEATPRTFSKLDEEELRDVILAHLNLYFVGGATGEAFRVAGKTDIRIEDGQRSAFVAECKVWSGPSAAGNAADQLLSYTTWRDSKAALIFFNKSASRFSELPGKLHDALKTHPYFVSEVSTGHPGEFRVVMRTKDDEVRRVTVQAFIFNIYQSKK